MDNFSKMVEGVKITIEKMKKTPAELPWYMSVEQLEMTLKELDNMNQIRDMRQFMPYYPRGIADSWEFDDKMCIRDSLRCVFIALNVQLHEV